MSAVYSAELAGMCSAAEVVHTTVALNVAGPGAAGKPARQRRHVTRGASVWKDRWIDLQLS